jgi:hypothetical protein
MRNITENPLTPTPGCFYLPRVMNWASNLRLSLSVLLLLSGAAVGV